MKQKIVGVTALMLIMMFSLFLPKANATGLTYVYKANANIPVYEEMNIKSEVITTNEKESVFFAQEMKAGWLYIEQQKGYVKAENVTRQKGMYYLVNTSAATTVYSKPSRQSKLVANAFAQSIVVKFNDVVGGWSAVNYSGTYGYMPTAMLKQAKGSAITVTSKAGAELRKLASPSAKVVGTVPVKTTLQVYTNFKGWSYVANDHYSGYVKSKDLVAPKPVPATTAKPKPVTGTKKIALTFDDGPNAKVTPQILATLKKHHVQATFFVLGEKVQANPKLAKRIVDEGHQIANHSWNHRDLSKLSTNAVKEDLTRTNAVIKKVTGMSSNIYRPPYGAMNTSMRKNISLTPVLWTVDTLDWKHRNPAKTLAYVKSGARDGGIILMHDIHQQTANSLESVIVYLQQQGYRFVTIDEL